MLKLKKSYAFYITMLLITVLTIVIMWLTFDYCDLNSMTAWTLNIWDLIFDPQMTLMNFYEYTQLNVHGAFHDNCAGNYLWLLPWCLWNFPLWLITKVFGISNVVNIYCLLWSKLFLVLLHCGTAYLTYKISEKLGHNQNFLAFLLMLASPEILISVGYAGQDEIVYMFCFLLAIYQLLCEKKLSAYLLCIITVSFCPIMILPVSVLILYGEKRIIPAVVCEMGILIPLMVFEYIYRHDSIYQNVKRVHSLTTLGSSMLNESTLDIGMGTVSICIVLCLIIYFLCYTSTYVPDVRLIYYLSLMMVIINFFTTQYFYRAFLYVPFLILITTINLSNINVNIFLLCILIYCRMFSALKVNGRQCMNTFYVMKNSWVTKICDKLGSQRYLSENSVCLYNYFQDSSYNDLITLITTSVAFSCGLLLLYINNPLQKRIFKFDFNYRICVFIYIVCMPLILVAFWIMLT